MIQGAAAICAKCKKPINKSYIKALGKIWHLKHFQCIMCGVTLSGKPFLERNGNAYCIADFLKKFCHKCCKCDQYITKEVVKALGKVWHVHCFTCTTCKKPVQPPYFFEKNGKPYCINDYVKNFAPVCKGCDQNIFENYLSVLGGKWHPNCFTCTDCKKLLTDKYFIINEKQTCESCLLRKGKVKYKEQCYQKCCSFHHLPEKNTS